MTRPPTLHELFTHRVRLTPDAEAYVDGDLRLSFADAERRVAALAAHLADLGVTPGDRVAILAKNSEFVATSLFAAARIGAIAVAANWRLPVLELTHVLTDSDPVVILHDDDFGHNVDRHTAATGHDLKRVVRHSTGAGGYADIVSRGGAAVAPAQVDPDDPAVIMYTSGTTGRAKGAVLTHANLFWSADGMIATMPWEPSHRFLLVAPMFHIGGLAPLVAGVLRGSTTVFMRDFDPVASWATIAQERITTMMTVPIMARALLHVANATPVDSSSLLNISCGAAPVPPDLVTAFAKLGVVVQVVYGATEFSGILTFSGPALGPDYGETQGRAVFHSELKIVAPDTGTTLPPGTTGEVWIRGPQRFAGYWRNEEATASAITEDGWYRSGDIGHVDAKGVLTLVDRLKDMIISGGENIYPAELEAVLSLHPGVREVAVIGQPDETWGEVPVAYIVATAGSQLDTAELIAWSRERLAGYKIPKTIHVIAQLPVNAVGKILKGTLRARQHGAEASSTVNSIPQD